MQTITQIIQVVPNLTAGDAVSNYARTVNVICKKAGFNTIFCAERVEQSFHEDVLPLRKLPQLIAKSGEHSLVLYHHSHGCDTADTLCAMPQLRTVRRTMFYHNITPPELLAFAPDMAAHSWRGLQQLTPLCEAFNGQAVTPSEFNAQGLREAGWTNVRIVPLAVDDAMAAQLQTGAAQKTSNDEAKQILFVGRVVPNKGIAFLLEAMKLLTLAPQHAATQLHIVGTLESVPDYATQMQLLAATLFTDTPHTVQFHGKVSHEALLDFYTRADVLAIPSRHEGFCMPAVEACFASVPIVALAHGALPETLADGCGILVSDPDPATFAETIAYLLETPAVCAAMRAAQTAHAPRYSVNAIAPTLLAALGLR